MGFESTVFSSLGLVKMGFSSERFVRGSSMSARICYNILTLEKLAFKALVEKNEVFSCDTVLIYFETWRNSERRF